MKIAYGNKKRTSVLEDAEQVTDSSEALPDRLVL